MNLYVRTASKYDDCQLLHVPNVVLLIKLDWLCLGMDCSLFFFLKVKMNKALLHFFIFN